MLTRTLPLNALRAFEASARHLNFSKAADELCVTHSAISQQVRQLESLLNLALFERTNRGVELTGSGRMLLPIVSSSFGRIGDALGGLMDVRNERSICVTTTPTFAATWLVPRLKRWRERHPGVAVHLKPSLEMLRIGGDDIDVGVRCGVPPWPGLAADLLLPIHMTPVCSPAFLKGDGLANPADLLRFPLLHADVGGHEFGEEWRTWLFAAGIEDIPRFEGLSFHDPGLALQAAIDGLGIAIAYDELAAAEIASGRLVKPFPLTVRHAFSYYVVYPEARRHDALIGSFRRWAIFETQADPSTGSTP